MIGDIVWHIADVLDQTDDGPRLYMVTSWDGNQIHVQTMDAPGEQPRARNWILTITEEA
jgi:hypothetical protein